MMDVTEFARMGGKARAAAMSSEERRRAAVKAITARWEAYRLAKKARKPKRQKKAA